VRVYEVLGYYHDAFVRTNDGWAIQNRRVEVNLRLVTRLYCRPDVLTGVSAHAAHNDPAMSGRTLSRPTERRV
jgi:hypothetical protein